MAIDYIPVNRTKQLGNKAVRLAGMIREVQDLVDEMNDVAGHSHDGSDYSTLETNFGLETGAGANFATLLVLLQNIFNTTTTVAGADRLSQLNEFTSRLGGQ